MNNAYRDMLQQSLSVAEGLVVRGAGNVARQAVFVANLRRDGLDTRWACRVLGNFQRAQAHSLVERDRLLALLADR